MSPVLAKQLSLLDLPNELLCQILALAGDYPFLSRCNVVCQKFAEVISSPGFASALLVQSIGTKAFRCLSKSHTTCGLDALIRKCLQPNALWLLTYGFLVDSELLSPCQEYLTLDIPRNAVELSKWLFAAYGLGGVSNFDKLIASPYGGVKFLKFDITLHGSHRMVYALLVNMVKLGCPLELLDEVRAPLKVSMPRSTKLASVDSVHVSLLDSRGTVLCSYDERNLMEESVIFRNYPPGVRFVIFRCNGPIIPCRNVAINPTISFVLC